MIAPTLLVAIWIAWKNKHIAAELAHNVAIALWIVANSIWMIAEFNGVDEEVKPYCIIPFSLGILILLYYYLIYAPMQRRKAHTDVLQVSASAVQQDIVAVAEEA